jgi:hypothetical protein
VDADLIVSAVAFAIILLNAASLFVILSMRDRVGEVSKRLDAQAQRISRLTEWLEGQKPARKNAK